MGKNISIEFESTVSAQKFFNDYGAVWHTVGENYTILGLPDKVVQEGINLAAIHVHNNPDAFKSFKGLSPGQLSTEIKLQISKVLSGFASLDPHQKTKSN